MALKLLTRMSLLLPGNRSAKGIKLSKQMKYYRLLRNAQWEPAAVLQRRQAEMLYHIAMFALEYVPHYRELHIDKKDFNIENITEKIQEFPILTKDIIRNEGKRLCAQQPINDWLYTNTSGGTTGEPVTFFQTGRFFDADQGAKLLYDEWAGRRIGDKQIRLWGSERDIVSGKKDWMNKIYRSVRNEMFLNTFVMSEANMDYFIEQINQQQPAMILAYVQSIRELALYIKHKGRKVFSPRGIMTSAGTLSPEVGKLIGDVFNCPVFNRYGSRELGDMACSCNKAEGLHINTESCFIEILDNADKRCPNGTRGRIVVTSLTNEGMPIIRYDIGDIGILTDHVCSCGRGFPMLQNVTGRTIDIFVAKNGAFVDGEYFTHLFYDKANVKQFQVIQETVELIRVKMVLLDKKKNMEDEYMDMTVNIQKAMGEVSVQFDLVDDIPLSQSGKRIYTISRVYGGNE